MTYEPTRTEARLFVACLCVFWLAAGVAAWTDVWLLFAAGVGSAATAWAVQARIVSRATGVPVRRILGFGSPFGISPEERAARRAVAYAAVHRSWWRAVVAASGWPGPLVAVVLVATLAIAVVGTVVAAVVHP